MFGNYLAAALRNLVRNRGQAAINLFGLALGFTAAILIALYVRDEYSYERFWPNHERIYVVEQAISVPGQAPSYSLTTLPHISAALKLDFPQVETAARLRSDGVRLRHGDVEAPATASWVDPDFFRLFPTKIVSGNLESAVSRPDGIVLTRRMARQLFGRDDALGQPVELNRAHTLRVTAVIEDLPSNTHLNGDAFVPALASFSRITALEDAQTKGGLMAPGQSIVNYVRLRPGASIADINLAMPQFAKTHLPGELNGVSLASAFHFSLVPIDELHLLPLRIEGLEKPAGDARILHAMIGVAALILFVAGSNFVSMMTARAARRAVEVAVRKAVGATRRQIITQFTGECLLYVGLALTLALIAVELVMPAFNGFLQRDIAFDYLGDPLLGMSILAVAGLTGLAASAYPALILSLFRPSAVLKGTSTLPGGSFRLRQAMVIFQFGTLIALTVATVTIYRQTDYAINDRLRLPGDQIYVSRSGCSQAFVDQAKQLAGVREVACTSDPALSFSHSRTLFSARDDRKLTFIEAQVDYHFFDLFNIIPVAGRVLSIDRGEDDLLRTSPDSHDNPSIVVNESGARALGFSSPAEAVGQSVRWARHVPDGEQSVMAKEAPSRVVGVIPDFSLGSVRDVIDPAVYYVGPAGFLSAVVKLDGGAIPETLRALRGLWTKQGQTYPFEGFFIDQYVNWLHADIKQQAVLFSIFAIVTIGIAALGLLGLAIFTAERRTKEIGLRKVMGASRTDILKFLGWQFAKPLLWANVVAWPCAFYFMHRWLEGFAYHIDLSFLAFVEAGALALLVAFVTVAGHAFMVARAKPVEALRYE